VGQAILFNGIAEIGVPLIHYYLWWRMVRDTTRSRRARWIGTGILLGLAALLFGTLIGSRRFPARALTVLSWPAYLWLAVLFYLLVGLAVLELPAFVARRRLKVKQDESRRLFLARTVAITAGVASAGIVGYGVTQALGDPVVKRVQIPLAKLPRGTDGFRIALVSDIHLGPLNNIGRTRRTVELINQMGADLVAVVGDLVDGSVEQLDAAVQPLRDLRGRYGQFFVTGNHEYYSGYEGWVAEVAGLGIRPLRNERIELPGGLDLAGVNDVTGASYHDAPDYAKALNGRDPARPVVLLAHQPIQAHEAAAHGVDLQLSGHTHGGQMQPFGLVVRAAQQPILSGYGQVDGMPVYVTNGAGFWGPPVRVGATPDVTLVELRTR
jgi:predicted MPP superfamily phosphohydrolase